MKPRICRLGLRPYREVWQAMRDYTEARDEGSEDQLWLVEHPPVYTQGLAGRAEHVLHADGIEVVQIDRGGQVTYHGPGQAVVYLLLDIRRAGVGIRALVTMIEQSVIDLLAAYGVPALARADAPGVYVRGEKIASLGLKVRRGCTYHGVALNVDMDLRPFLGINPCGMAGLHMTQLADHGITLSSDEAALALATHLCHHWQAACDAA